MLNNYASIVDKLKEDFLEDVEEEDSLFMWGEDFMRFRFKTDDNLVYSKKINIPVCVISLNSIVKEDHFYYLRFKLQSCFYESHTFLKKWSKPSVM